jgi:predicted secreted protein
MKKPLLHLTAAVILGILAIIAPLLALAPMERATDIGGVGVFLGEGLRHLEGSNTYGVNAPYPYFSDFAVLAISFVIAMVVYLYVRHRIPRIDAPWVRIPPC